MTDSPTPTFSPPSSSDNNNSSRSPSPRSSKAAAHFTFEISIIPYLFFAATYCRCPITRRECVALLERNPPREGLWDAKQCAVLARRTIEIEEEGRTISHYAQCLSTITPSRNNDHDGDDDIHPPTISPLNDPNLSNVIDGAIQERTRRRTHTHTLSSSSSRKRNGFHFIVSFHRNPPKLSL